MRSESRRRAVVILGSRVKGPSNGAFPSPAAENPPGDMAAAEDPPAECGEGSVASSRLDNLPRSSSMVSRNEVWSLEGRFSLGVLVPRICYPHMLRIKHQVHMAQHQNENTEPEPQPFTRRTPEPVVYTTT